MRTAPQKLDTTFGVFFEWEKKVFRSTAFRNSFRCSVERRFTERGCSPLRYRP